MRKTYVFLAVFFFSLFSILSNAKGSSPLAINLTITGTLSHGSVCIGTAATTITYTITNTGTTTANVITAVSNNSEFVVSNLIPTTIAGGGTATFKVTFTPTASGNRAATITVSSTSVGSNSPTAPLTGIGLANVGTPVFALGANSTRCQGGGTVTYTATATNGTVNYSIVSVPATPVNTINATGVVTWAAGFVGTATITATPVGCNPPAAVTHVVTVTSTVGTPVFVLGPTSTRCQGAGNVTYTATAANGTVNYSIVSIPATPVNTINSTTGEVTWAAGFAGTATITATPVGCNPPAPANHAVTVTPTVGTPVFALGANSTRCQGGGTVTYTATATNGTVNYSIVSVPATPVNTINATGVVTWAAGFAGTATITATPVGCNPPTAVTHVVTVTSTVGTPVFVLGPTSTRCQGAGNVTYTATATNGTVNYSIVSIPATPVNTINSTTGEVTWAAGFAGTATITATPAGCNPPAAVIHTVTVTPTVGTPVFALGSTSTRCQGAGNVTYTATVTNGTVNYSIVSSPTTPVNTINPTTGVVTWAAGFAGTATITATPVGCNPPAAVIHTVTVTPTVGTPVFALGSTSTRCQGAGNVTYTAAATNGTVNYSIVSLPTTPVNTINATTGAVTWDAGFAGTATITATPVGCNPPAAVTHTVTVKPLPIPPDFGPITNVSQCQTSNQTFDISNPVANVVYTWSASNGIVLTTTASPRIRAIVQSNTGSGPFTITVTGTVSDPDACSSSNALTFPVGSAPSPLPKVIYNGSDFVCLTNVVDSFQWGYDNKADLVPTIYPGETLQNHAGSVSDTGTVTTGKYIWVITFNSGSCHTKTYFNPPYGRTGAIITPDAGSPTDAISIYPNPVSNTATITWKYNSSYDKAVIQITDMAGRLMRRYQPDNMITPGSTTINLDGLQTGMYIITILQNNKQTAKGKMLKK